MEPVSIFFHHYIFSLHPEKGSPNPSSLQLSRMMMTMVWKKWGKLISKVQPLSKIETRLTFTCLLVSYLWWVGPNVWNPWTLFGRKGLWQVFLRDKVILLFSDSRWWGNKRIDYSLLCPQGLQNFPQSALVHLCYNSYWESKDLVTFMLWQVCMDLKFEKVVWLTLM